jgi:PIN domain nuclease of toxin-antitoxin system
MKLLVDTHILLWMTGVSHRLPPTAREMIEDASNLVFFSAASIWEVAIKAGRGFDGFSVDARKLRSNLIGNEYRGLPIRGEHALGVANLPDIHKDPFDRIMIAQSFVEGLVLLTADKTVARYGGLIRLI